MTELQRLSDVPERVRLTIGDYALLADAGAFQSYNKVELIDGQILVVNAQYSPHFKAKTRLLRRIADACDALGTGLEAWSEGAVAIPPDSVPEPDVFVTRRTPDEKMVSSDTVALVVEVAATTQAFDLGAKARLYAGAGIPEYWIADLDARAMHQLWMPADGIYGQRRIIPFGDAITAATIVGLDIPTTGL